MTLSLVTYLYGLINGVPVQVLIIRSGYYCTISIVTAQGTYMFWSLCGYGYDWCDDVREDIMCSRMRS
jgi:hypothetical protein